MPITIVTTGTGGSSFNTATPVSSSSLSVQAGDLITVSVAFRDDIAAGTLTPTNSGTALTWTLIQDANVGGAVRIASWWARASATESTTVSVGWNSGNNLTWAMYWANHRGADTSATPIGSSSKASNVASASYAITPAGTGSALWMVVGDAAGTGTQTISAGANCGIVQQQGTVDTHASALISPTTNPRTDAAAFTLAETHTGTGGSWVGFEVKAEATVSPIKRLSMLGIG